MKLSSVLVLGLAVGSGACGGGAAEMPKPLTMHFDDMFIARVPMEQKQSMVTTQNDWALAKMDKANVDAELDHATTLVKLAKIDRDAASLAKKSASTSKSAADKSMDQTQINAAAKQVDVADKSYRAADLRVSYLNAYRSYLQVLQMSATENMYWQEARYENSKADIAKQNNISPSGFKSDDYSKQEMDRAKKAGKRKSTADSAKSRAESARQAWLKAQAEADQMSGKTSNLEDPMAPKPAPAPATTSPTTPAAPTTP